MLLFAYKGLSALIIAIVTLTAGFASLHFIRRYQHLLSMGDAFADGIFLGAAVFHLFPDAVQRLSNKLSALSSYVLVIVLMGCVFLLLFSLERSIILREKQRQIISAEQMCTASAWMLTGILSAHAFIAGAALGISDSASIVSILLIAILAHKGFESFALMIGLHRGIKKEKKIKVILWAFTFVTLFGIIVAAFIESFLQTQTAAIITSLFSAFAAGSFFYIGTLHGGYEHFHPPRDSLKRYQKVLATSLGIVAMGIVAIRT
ncbi:ZIP family metal transporter [Candidatus Coxiella mudrowiae]|uniref:ZIP family metal transporter n=1 Tax=Candidatus Coxiella mudrowiae TaxID=2054173 RepID=UPI000C28DD7B|nr:ZIP family metal transporter [Candidatus Coxiella mudrowiae]